MSNLRLAACIHNQAMTYHVINPVSLGISIEGIACGGAIEILEKRRLLSQVGGGAVAGAISATTPLFALNSHLQSCYRWNAHSSSNKHSIGLLKKGAMAVIINSESIQKTKNALLTLNV